ncbi:MAG: hypothetical protein ACE5IP_01560 [Terriglobia bacterium]
MPTQATKLKSGATLLAILALALLASTVPVWTQPEAFPELDRQLEPLRSRFNADAGKVRLLLLLDPT